MKKLDKLILKAFAGPFFLTFAVVEFIFLTQYMLKYLDDIIGKDLGAGVIAQLLFFFQRADGTDFATLGCTAFFFDDVRHAGRAP
ncbi:LptF/LptG family permease [Hymenobacter aerilatus]|uniref:LptF/LptG family permease n=1 Tax=Hymenobacter aerilatus TaxID=2932251 RepID=A0A8T9SZB7_9BACT|nr:LptF/LptG family permease [Hymenobacter aerilatus]UOR06987.1 LptF/LptG family permease [Hymenobacter aerilatus]